MSEQGLATVENRSSALGEVAVTQDQVALIKNTVAVGATDDELKLFFFECRRRGVHPMDRLIHFVKRQGKATFQCSIDFMRMQAEDTGLYRGQEDVEYGPIDKDGFPEWARAIVKKKDPDTGEIYPNPSTVYWTEFYPGEQLGFMWKKMPRIMLGKVAEAQALRKAFPRQFNNLYTFDEMQQADLVASGTPKGDKPPMTPPQEKKATGDTVVASVIVAEVFEQEGVNKKTGKPYTKYTIKDESGIEYGTFSKSFAQFAHESIGTGFPIKITYKQSKFGNDVENIALPEGEGEQG